jgi:hypothetical protein
MSAQAKLGGRNNMEANEIVKVLRKFLIVPNGSGADVIPQGIATQAADLIESLQKQLEAAKEDLYAACKGSPCNNGICVKKNCTGNVIPCGFEWRGTEEVNVNPTD